MAATFKMNLDMRGASSKMKRGAGKGLELAAEHLLTEANKLVPHQEGTLQRSGATDVDAGDLRAAVSYDTPYAVRQHEDLSLRHDEGREAKYLERTMSAERTTVGEIIATAVRSEVR